MQHIKNSRRHSMNFALPVRAEGWKNDRARVGFSTSFLAIGTPMVLLIMRDVHRCIEQRDLHRRFELW